MQPKRSILHAGATPKEPKRDSGNGKAQLEIASATGSQSDIKRPIKSLQSNESKIAAISLYYKCFLTKEL